MAAQLVRRFPQSFRLIASTRQFTVGATLTAKDQPTKKPSPPVEDPVKKLFLEKIKEYSAKASGGKLPDVTPAAEKELSDELSRLKRIYGEGDLSKLPSFEFKDVDIGTRYL